MFLKWEFLKKAKVQQHAHQAAENIGNVFQLIDSFQPLRKMCGNRTTWLKEATSAENQLVSVNLVKAVLPSWLSFHSIYPFLFTTIW